MKRVKAACLQQTLHFMLKEDIDRTTAVAAVQQEVIQYKAKLDSMRTKYRILSEETLPDGSILIEIKKQYNASPVGSYLDN